MGAGVAQEISQPAYALLNARVDWENVFGKGFSVSLFGKNLTDKVYATAGDVALTSVGIADKEYAEPRTFGIELRYRFGP
jgi:iron complex outermembrane receptor protein